MRSSVIAFLLSFCTVAALGQCVAPATATTTATGTTRPAVIARQAADLTARQSPELISAAGAVTHDEAPTMQVMQPSPPRSRAQQGERPRRAGPAMLLAALALMSGIALRRYSSRDR